MHCIGQTIILTVFFLRHGVQSRKLN